ncbi:MAG: hypothetical protein ACXVZ1_09010, partial [Gaiellaceae bacterium]
MRLYDTIVCPACGQRSSVRDPNHFQPFGKWEGRVVVTCRVCGGGLAVSPSLRGPQVTLIDANLWLSLKDVRQFALPVSRAGAVRAEGGSASTGAQDLLTAVRELGEAETKIRGALDLLKRSQVDRHDPRRMALHQRLAAALVLVRDLALDAKGSIKARERRAERGT